MPISTLTNSSFAFGVALAALGLVLLWVLLRPPRAPSAPSTESCDTNIAFLFEDGLLADATPGAARLIQDGAGTDDLIALMDRRFPGVADALQERQQGARIASVLPEDTAYLELDQRGDHLSVALHDTACDSGDRHLLLSRVETTDRLTNMLEHAPLAIWAEDGAGRTTQTNRAFQDLVDFSGKAMPFDLPEVGSSRSRKRIWIEDPENEQRRWFDLTSHDTEDGVRIHYATNADAIVSAEIAQRNFVQTLTKTFAQLSIGLAIFDRQRQLALFNPALIDLTALPADFLSARPTLGAFFDQLRDRQIMPEPRNYQNWRDQLSDMIDAARDGAYCETWTLPNGLTYRISGKPHPDGAVAFLFEDISAEITLTRRFRAELEQSQAVLDAVDCALAVFSRSGVLTFANTAFRELWQCNPDESFIELTIVDVSKVWQQTCAPSPVWGELRDFVRSVDERADWQDIVEHRTRGPLSVMAAPVSGGATMVRFTELAAAQKIDAGSS